MPEFQKDSNCTFQVSNWPVLLILKCKYALNQRGGISTQVPKIFSFSGSYTTFVFDSFGAGKKISMNPRDGGISKSFKLYISSLKLAGFPDSKVNIPFNPRGGVSKQVPKIFILSG